MNGVVFRLCDTQKTSSINMMFLTGQSELKKCDESHFAKKPLTYLISASVTLVLNLQPTFAKNCTMYAPISALF